MACHRQRRSEASGRAIRSSNRLRLTSNGPVAKRRSDDDFGIHIPRTWQQRLLVTALLHCRASLDEFWRCVKRYGVHMVPYPVEGDSSNIIVQSNGDMVTFDVVCTPIGIAALCDLHCVKSAQHVLTSRAPSYARPNQHGRFPRQKTEKWLIALRQEIDRDDAKMVQVEKELKEEHKPALTENQRLQCMGIPKAYHVVVIDDKTYSVFQSHDALECGQWAMEHVPDTMQWGVYGPEGMIAMPNRNMFA